MYRGQCANSSIHARNTVNLLVILKGRHKAIALVYSLLIADYSINLTIPAATGAAIDGVLRGSRVEAVTFAACWLGSATLSAIRRSVDTRIFSSIVADTATGVVMKQTRDGKSLNIIAARSSLSREIVSFYAQDLPALLKGIITSFGSILLMSFYYPLGSAICLVGAIPSILISYVFFKKTRATIQKIHDAAERDLNLIRTGSEKKILNHHRILSKRRILHSDREAMASYIISINALAFLLMVIFNVTEMNKSFGSTYSVIAYAVSFFGILYELPVFIGAIARIRDISLRLQ
jgi:hypothetical protein